MAGFDAFFLGPEMAQDVKAFAELNRLFLGPIAYVRPPRPLDFKGELSRTKEDDFDAFCSGPEVPQNMRALADLFWRIFPHEERRRGTRAIAGCRPRSRKAA